MNTFIYMIRHGDSPKEGNERTRGLSEKGWSDASQITELLKNEQIDAFVSSPYLRAILTIKELADLSGQEIILDEALKERVFSADTNRLTDEALMPLLEKSYADPDYALPGGESNNACQHRAITVLQELLTTYRGRKVAIGTHGAVMTLMLAYYDQQYDLDFLLQLSKPDVYRMEFHDHTCVGVKRLWGAPHMLQEGSQ